MWNTPFMYRYVRQEEDPSHYYNLRKILSQCCIRSKDVVRCCNLDTSESISETLCLEKFWKVVVVVGKEGEDQLDREINIIWSQGGLSNTIKRRLTGLVTSWVGTAFYNRLLKERYREEVTGRWGRRRKQVLVDATEKRGYCELKEEGLDRALWRTGFGKGCRSVVRQTAEWMNEWIRLFCNDTNQLNQWSWTCRILYVDWPQTLCVCVFVCVCDTTC